MKAKLRPAFYALSTGAWRDYVTLLHPPYTVWHLSYVVLGAAAAPIMRPERVAGVVLAFFLAVGLGAHALDEFQGRPLDTKIPGPVLIGMAGISLVAAVVIGTFAALTISPWATPFILFGALMVPAYNLELMGGWFHTRFWFAFSWGAFPALVGYWANAEGIGPPALLVAAGCFALSLSQRALSSRATDLRRNVGSASGKLEYRDGNSEEITVQYLLAAPETALRTLGLAVTLLALGWLVSRL
jgi:hypothetical protein